MSSQVLLYSGPGAGPFCTQALENQLKNLCDDRIHMIRSVNSLSDCWSDPESVKSLFIPGGNTAAMWVQGKVRESASNIRELLHRYKISYYGACAGGILAASTCHERFSICSDTHPKFTTNESNYLGLFPGKVIAPLFPKPNLGKLSVKDFNLRNVESVDGEMSILSALILSPGYLNAQEIEGTKILATYCDRFSHLEFASRPTEEGSAIGSQAISEALIYQGIDKAPALLTGSHPEIDSTAVRSEKFKGAFNATNEEQEELAGLMQTHDASRKNLLQGYFEKIGISCKNI